jgi:hypothetical protein
LVKKSAQQALYSLGSVAKRHEPPLEDWLAM